MAPLLPMAVQRLLLLALLASPLTHALLQDDEDLTFDDEDVAAKARHAELEAPVSPPQGVTSAQTRPLSRPRRQWPYNTRYDEEDYVNEEGSAVEEGSATGPPECQPGEWQCASGTCVPRCDGVAQCSDHSDEKGCDFQDLVVEQEDGCPGDNKFTCLDGSKICDVHECDGVVHCGDGSDESQCGCYAGQFLCDTVRCLPLSMKCDGIPDCVDGKDEENCDPTVGFAPSTTTPAPTTTTTTKLQCITDDTPRLCNDGRTEACFCDGIPQCPEGDDEDDCAPVCSPGEQQCPGGEDTCIRPDQTCDGITDCFNGLDEENCDVTEVNMVCPEGEFRCSSDGHCISITERCDGLVQCLDGSDEAGCPCREHQWTCRDRSCISLSGRCDGTIDCADKSDEVECVTAPPTHAGCQEDEFRCGEGSCVPERDRCDGVSRCPDGTDEEGCAPPPCGSGEFTCRDGACIPDGRRCDGYRDCADNSDEYNCPPRGCKDEEWTCRDGSCVPLSARCDGAIQCDDLSDEENCPPPTPGCGPRQWPCELGGCISESARCDGYAQCYDGSDERDCPTCGPGEFTCGDGSCVPENARCDRLNDCRDASDETGCPTAPEYCRSGQFTCRDGSCVPEQVRCDGRADCRDGSDESECQLGGQLCRDNEWQCNDGSCIHAQDRCNNRFDCFDRSDEENCPGACQPGEWQCVASRRCIPEQSRCNGLQECQDGSDERDCRPTCKPDEFSCVDDGTCIPLSLVCDGRPYCRDQSDEHNCHSPICRPNQFRCDNGTCLEQWQKCNGVSECGNGEDERSCPCQPEQHLCERDGICIRKSQVCDGRPDCSDASDELNCEEPCGRDEWQCSDGQCIPRSYRCDGRSDCSDSSDEIVDCRPPTPSPPPTRPPPRCPDNEFECQSGECILRAYRCDGIPDCSDGSDEREQECTRAPDQCSSNKFACTSGECLDMDKRCDRVSDCTDSSDELGCPFQNKDREECSETEFRCTDGACIEKAWLCDSVPDCLDGSDEKDCCKTTEFRCGDGSCIPNHFRCDSKFDCTDGSDERENCECGASDFQCGSGDCVSRHVHCDGNPDCRDGSDELNCPCVAGQFQCSSGQCVWQDSRCNGIRDCYDGSDELGCFVATNPPPVPCRTGEFQCYIGDCVPEYARCDGHFDCRDASDEDGCTTTTSTTTTTTTTTTPRPRPPPTRPNTNTFQCQDGRIINYSQRCDGRRDCPDGSDEYGCETDINLKTYPDEQTIQQTREVVFQCRDEGTVRAPVRWVREGGRSLPPGSTDVRGRLTMPNIQLEHAGTYYCEAQGVSASASGWRKPVYLQIVPYTIATVAPSVVCTIHESTCMSGECINKTQVCDGRPDCKDSSDEMRCDFNGCEPNEFLCDNRRCVLKTWLCDSDNDCGDNSDEQNCEPSPPDSLCRHNEFTCRSGTQCIPKSFHCDGDIDCVDTSDEVGCSKPIVVEPPPRNVMVQVGETFTLTCRVIGVPTPIVLWRLNWGHVPAKCQMTSVEGRGMLVCPNAQPTDQGAYSCEAINGKGSVFATPDAIVVVKGNQPVVCQPPTFNTAAVSQEDCLNCFCFGTTDQCYSSDLSITQLPPPSSHAFTLIGANQDLSGGNYVVRDTTYPLSSSHLVRYQAENQYSERVALGVDRSKLGGPRDLVIYFSLPESHRGQQLASYGGMLHYRIRYSRIGASQTTSQPDVIIRGNNITLMHVHDGTFRPDFENQVDVRFSYGQWFKRVGKIGGNIQTQGPATREEIMMVLENMDLLLIRALYTDGDFINTTLSDVQMDTAQIARSEQGQAVLVEQCVCPPGYIGISCQDCAPNYSRVQEGPWLGRCVSDLTCGANEYGDPASGVPCLKCPCPLTTPNNQFSSSCFLDNDGQVTCNCQQGYEGRRCQYCASGYEGNPSVAGDNCKPVGHCDPAGSVEVDPVSGYCECKEFTTGPRCDQCKNETFYLSEENSEGCIPCFCMGITSKCSSSNLYRQQESAYFTNDRQGFEVVDIYLQNLIKDGLFVDSSRQELVFRDFHRYGQKVYYWKLPQRFLGDKVTSYGGNLTYTLRFVPAPGGQSSTNSAYDVEIYGNDIVLRHFRQRQPSLSAARQETVTVALFEQYWQRQNGQEVNREHLMMALADLEHIHIKATYTTTTDEVSLKEVTLDFAEARNTGRERAYAVEMCECPPEYQGTSCEDCAVGYTRSLSGIHIGTCAPCDCSGHSTECDPVTGVCFNCRNNTAGNYCELCAPGYTRYGDVCYRDATDNCNCDSRGSVSCDGTRCHCKAHVFGSQCDSCRPGYFHLSLDNPDGCLSCWCSGTNSQCFSSNYYRLEMPMQLLTDHGFTFTNRPLTDVLRDGFNINLQNNEISFSSFENLRDRETYFWSLPQMFTGNRLESYGGNLTVTQRYQTRPGGNTYAEPDIIIRSTGGREFIWMMPRPLQQNLEQTYSVVLTEDSFTMNQQPASRSEFLRALSSIEAILIRATLSEQMTATFLSNVIMDTAVSIQTGQARAMEVEQCRCPKEYSGLSCEMCKPGHYRNAATNQCYQCPCNGHESSCTEQSDGSVKCECLPGYYGSSCGESAPPSPPDERANIVVTISEPSIKVVTVNSTVQLSCSARSVTDTQTRIPVTWSKAAGELPYGRARDNRQGLLVITEVRVSDSGIYICAAVDSYGRVVTENITLTVSRGPPVVILEPRREQFDVEVRGSLAVRCSVEGTPQAQVTWTYGRTRPLPPNVYEQNGVLTFRDAQPSDTGEYFCTSINAYGEGVARIYINVASNPPSPPGQYIIIQLSEENVVARAGETVRVRCSAGSSLGSISISWARHEGLLPSQSVVDNGELQIPGAQPADSGIYICRITEQLTSIYNEASTRITVSQYTSLPTVQIQPERQTINQGSNAEMFCRASGDPPPTIVWSKINEELGPRVTVDNNVLRITAAQIIDRGMYVCTARNEAGSAQGAAIIEVERREPPQIEMYPERKQTIVVGASALFQCHLTAGIPTPVVHWTRTDGQPFTPNTETLSGGVLRFNEVRGDEEATYMCTAENDAGSVTSTAVLEIQSLPTISIRPGTSPFTVHIGEPVRLECLAQGDPAPSVSWKKLQINFPTSVSGISGRSGVAVYEIASVSKADEGTYVCSAQNSAGVTDERLQLLVQDSLPGTLRPLPPPDSGSSGSGSTGDGSVVYVPAGSAYEFTCSGYGPETEDLQFTFQRSDNKPLPPGSHSTNNVLYLVNVDESATGEYACVGRDRISGVVRFTIYTIIEVIVPPRISLDPARQVVRPGELVQIRCSATGPQPITINWIKETGRMPASVIINGGELAFRGIATTDAGRYICVARNNGGTTRAVAEVVVNEEPLLTAIEPEMTLYVGQTAELRCETSGINANDVRWSRVGGRLPPNALTRGNVLRLPLIQTEDSGDYQCEAITPSGRRSYDIISLIIRSPQTTNIQVRSIPSDVRRGEDVELICEVENEPAAAINWRRLDGELPYGARTYGNKLRIPGVQSGGNYLCTATTRQGVFEERYGFVIRDIISQTEDHFDDVAQVLRSENTRSVELGLSVTMECSLSLSGPVSYTWSKKDEKLPPNARIDNSVFDIQEVRAEDAGVYVCTVRNEGRNIDLPTLLIVTGVVPRFNENSYLALQTLPRAYLMFDIEISFKPESPDGLILYNSQRAGSDEGDFVAFGLVGGFPEFRFNIGAGPAIIRGTKPLEMNQWHTVKLSRNRKEGRMVVNGDEPLVGVSQGRFLGLDLVEPLYLGGVPNFNNIHQQTGMTTGFKGCISRFVIGNTLDTGFVQNAMQRVGITSCQTCASNPCQNNGVCQEAYNKRGHRCFCPAGFLGELCENTGQSCYEGACGTGRCINKPGGFECYCPFGKIGDRCSQDITIYEPAFGDESYIAYPTPWARRRFAVDMNFMPQTLDDGVLMYCAQKESGSGDFTSLAIRNKRLEFRFNSGSGTANIQSDPISEGEWIKVRVNRTDRLGSLRVNDGQVMSGESPGNSLGLNLVTPLFIGGIDNSRIQVAADVGVRNGFRGCVSEIRVMDQDMPLSDALVDSANVGQCAGNSSPCSPSPCQHNSACVDDPTSPHGYTCHCAEGYSGNNCENRPGVCNMIQPCMNGGACVGQGHDYTCLCPIGFAGQHCEHVVQRIGSSAAFSGNSWVEVNRTLLPQEAGVPQTISFEFKTRRLNSLLFWYGQDPTLTGKGQDYISIAIKDGYVEFSYELGDGPALLRSLSRVDDGQFHSLSVERTGQQGILTLDREDPVVAHSPGQLHVLNAEGNIYIGGVPDFPLMTGGAHTSGFVGCIQQLVIGKHSIDRFLDHALSGVNVIPCPRLRGGRRKGTQRG